MDEGEKRIEGGRGFEINGGSDEMMTRADKSLIVRFGVYPRTFRHDRQTASALGRVSFHLSMPSVSRGPICGGKLKLILRLREKKYPEKRYPEKKMNFQQENNYFNLDWVKIAVCGMQ
jgi:hypothetical protein